MRTRISMLAAAVLAVTTSGCDLVDGGLLGDLDVEWVQATAETTVPATGLDGIEVSTDSGHVYLDGEAGSDAIHVVAKKRAGGNSPEDAEECMAAIEVIAKKDGNSEKLGWNWKTPRKASWRAEVSFEVRVPKRFSSTVSTHNGAVRVNGAEGSAHLTSHNGRVEAQAVSGEVDLETHDGAVQVRARPKRIRVVTHNGSIKADLRGSVSPQGTISTHNGSVQLALGDKVNVSLECTTTNGRVNNGLELQDAVVKRRRVSGRLGTGGDKLSVSTRNGSVTLTK